MANRFALIIGNSEYDDTSFPELKSPKTNVDGLHSVLENPKIGGFNHVKSLKDPTSTILKQELSHLLTYKKKDDLVVLYFSGYIVVDEHDVLYLVTKDSLQESLNSTAISVNFVTREMDGSKSQRLVLILDCHQSNLPVQKTRYDRLTSSEIKHLFEGRGIGRNVLIAFANSTVKFADHGIENENYSTYTHFLIQGLKSGHADINGNGFITINELHEYTYNKVQNHSFSITEKWSFKQKSDIIFARNHHKKTDIIPDNLLKALKGKYIWQQEGAIIELGHLLNDSNPILANKAHELLESMLSSESQRVSNAAKNQLNSIQPSTKILAQTNLKAEVEQSKIDNSLGMIRGQMNRHLSLGEIRTISFDLNIDFENLEGNTKNTKIIALLDFCKRRDCIDEVLQACTKINDTIDWSTKYVLTKNSNSISMENGNLNVDLKKPNQENAEKIKLNILNKNEFKEKSNPPKSTIATTHESVVDHTIRRIVKSPQTHLNGTIQQIVLSPTNHTFAVASSTDAWLFSTVDFKFIRRLNIPRGFPTTIQWSPDGTQIAAGSSDSITYIWDSNRGDLQRTLEGHKNQILSVSWHPSSRQLASAGMDNSVRVWQAGHLKEKLILEGHSQSVLSLDWSNNGSLVASGGADSQIRIWDAENGRCLTTIENHGSPVNTLSWSPDNKLLATGSDDSTISIWDMHGTLIKVASEHMGTINNIAWSEDGKRVASGSNDNTIRIWDTVNFQQQQLLSPQMERSGKSCQHTTLGWLNTNIHLISGGNDGIIRLWDLVKGIEQISLRNFFSPIDGRDA